MTNLQPTYGSFKLRGIVVGLDKENAYTEGVGASGSPYRKIRFNVKTSETNLVPVELYGSYSNEVIFRNRENRSSIRVPWESRYKQRDFGYELVGVKIGLDKDEKGYNITETLVAFDAVETLKNKLKNGDSVMIIGRPVFSEYEIEVNEQKQKRSQVKYEIQQIYRTSQPVDFKASNFEEINDFRQEIIVTDSTYDKQLNKLFVNTYIIIDKKGTFVSYQFTIDGTDENLHELIKTIKTLPFGSSLVVEGKIWNKAETVEVEEDGGNYLGYKSSFKRRAIKTFVKELAIRHGDEDTIQKARYKEDDFIRNWAEDISDEELPF